MNQADVSKLVSQLRIKVNPRLRRFRNANGPAGRLDKLRKTVTGLIKHERIELNYPRADEARMYAERLISDAIRYGDCHRTTMEMADFWITEKQLVHKLFKVLVPRFQYCTTSYTRLYKVPSPYPVIYKREDCYRKAVLELRGNPYPNLLPEKQYNKNLIHNILLEEARKEYRMKKYAEVVASIEGKEDTKKQSDSPEEKKAINNDIRVQKDEHTT